MGWDGGEADLPSDAFTEHWRVPDTHSLVVVGLQHGVQIDDSFRARCDYLMGVLIGVP